MQNAEQPTTVGRLLGLLGAGLLLLATLYVAWIGYRAWPDSPFVWLLSLLIGVLIGFGFPQPIGARTVFVTGLVISLIWYAAIQTIPVSDFLGFYRRAAAFAAEPSLAIWADAKSPITILYYALWIRLLGAHYVVTALAAILLWAVQGVLLRQLLLDLQVPLRWAGRLALFWVLAPDIITFTPVVSSESVFGTLLLLSIILALRLRRRYTVPRALGCGVVLSLALLTRGNALLYLWPLALLPLVTPGRLAVGMLLRRALPLLLGMLPLLTLQLAVNLRYHERLSFAAHHDSSLILLVGTNLANDGGFTWLDRQLVGLYDDLSPAERRRAEQRARQIAWLRINHSWPDFLHFALTTKLDRFWPTANRTLTFALTNEATRPPRASFEPIDRAYHSWLLLLLGGAVAAGVALLIDAAARRSVTAFQQPGVLLSSAVVAANAVIHLFIEVQPRYHIPFYTFLILLASSTAVVLAAQYPQLSAWYATARQRLRRQSALSPAGQEHELR